ncbi:transcriptional regulator [Stenotrophomonas chelatiphaga]|jgi:DNA-binding FadR family transcriptional regulator|uniref:Transcriptional regulator n=1 Tax=Stenotrophomonas chelatiphaga TaxID=517011 RepID=A0A0R0D305_9GAMM|nr:FadR/GntR family transcriptional regulator [Stenotrophomonas chelatiphaga]KRG72922.1 transcriptional regulator [Stenotrophomonas chelatiphaga]MCS4229886.1 DNA-binding FadR family transcriptional regulator [Stenotrophomonas chelatiphaga]ROQ38073.1 GntR family transcriptional regulator [Stenotrophomonas maltophilia]
MMATSSRSLHGQIVHELGKLIVAGQYKPGEILPREELLAVQLQVSRTALRESLRVLGSKGLIETRQKIGTRVRESEHWNLLDPDVLSWHGAALPTLAFVEQLAEMRELIEPPAAALAAQRRTDAQLARIGQAYAAMAASEDMEAWAAADLRFHHAVLDATGNALLRPLFSVIETALGSYLLLSARKADADFKYSLPRHARVHEAIAAQQPEQARQAMLEMIADSRSNLRSEAPAPR